MSYTSGATGRPKGDYGHPSWTASLRAAVTQIVRQHVATIRVYGLMPISHIFGVGTGLLVTLYFG
ncbi:AMP-binding protein [Cupriavidus basilensis]